MGTTTDVFSGEVCELANAAEESRYGERRDTSTAQKKGPWCSEWLTRLFLFVRHLSIENYMKDDISWLDAEGISARDLEKLRTADLSDGCIGLNTISGLASFFDFVDSQTFMDAALDFVPVKSEELKANEKSYSAEIDAIVKKMESMTEK